VYNRLAESYTGKREAGGERERETERENGRLGYRRGYGKLTPPNR